MPNVTTIYGIRRTQAELDFIDVDLHSDAPLFVDPYALTSREDNWSQLCHDMVVSFFLAVLAAVRAKERAQGIRLLSNLGEPEETHLGVSKPGNRGRGIGAQQAAELYEALRRSKAAKSGVLEDLSDFALFIPGIGQDKISDMTTNIIRGPLIAYTLAQCKLHGIPVHRVASGFCWNAEKGLWTQDYVELPVFEGRKLILVPKFMVRFRVGVNPAEYRSNYVLEFLIAEHERADDALVTVLKDSKGKIKRKIVYKKTVDKHYPKDKDFLATFSEQHPKVMEIYKKYLVKSAKTIPDISGDTFDEVGLARHLKDVLLGVSAGAKSASEFHDLCLGLLSFLFFPNLIYPTKEKEINEGRKRLDLLYTNGKESGLFYRLAFDQHVKANLVHVECKNYADDVGNPEFDQLLGRFDFNRGRFGLLLFRKTLRRDQVIARCRDAARQTHGIVIPMDDSFSIDCLDLVIARKRPEIDNLLERLYQEIIS